MLRRHPLEDYQDLEERLFIPFCCVSALTDGILVIRQRILLYAPMEFNDWYLLASCQNPSGGIPWSTRSTSPCYSQWRKTS